MNYEEKAKAYDKALEAMKDCEPDKDGYVTIRPCDIFHELAESEDERIRKWLIGYFNQYIIDGMPQVFGNGLNIKDVLAWLEKPGKEEYALKSFKDEDVRKFMQYIEKEAKAYEFNLPNRGYDIYAFAKDLLIWLEKQGKKFAIYDVETYNSANQKAWDNYEQFQYKVSPLTSKEIYDNGFHDGYQFGIHEEKPYKWTTHDECVRKEAISCLKSWKNIIPIEFNEDYKNILIWLENELSTHIEKQGEKESINTTMQEKAEIDGAFTDMMLGKKWSTRDEMMSDNCIRFLKLQMNHHASTCEIEGCIDWLKQLKQRMEG